MGEQGSSPNATATSSLSASMADFTVPTPLKFLMSNLKSIVNVQLSSDNYAIWRLQIFKSFSASGFDGYLTGKLTCPSEQSADYRLWKLIDQNLVSALISTISPSVLPCIIHLSTSSEIWAMLEIWLQPTNRSRVIQLKHELHNVKMGNQSIAQHLTQIKTIIDNIVVDGSNVDLEDIIIFILNGLSPTYNPLKAAIRTSLHSLNLESLYSQLCSKEIHIHNELQQDTYHSSDNQALYTNRTTGSRDRQGKLNRGRSSPFSSKYSSPRPPVGTTSAPTTRPQCQIYDKTGHTALSCWHRCNTQQYAPPPAPSPRAFISNPYPTEWVMDYGASSHLTADINNLQPATPYT
ncbi:hypothetical protein KFK09_026230 [Dendrobium nobile]|uniref:Retrovirus-related Pol polyprotein from transposon TNT 1-94 n=1 Tax=Dendrobium nobile TaxID=94219 RepID=A0A8T3A660_DENNO|nr:hypothetical protein KFK09_026230 [Dendrobium nobile]